MSRKRHTVADESTWIVRSSASNLRGGFVISDHVHDWHQLLYVSTGVITVWTEFGSWVAPSTCAVWVPSGVRHNLRVVGESALRTLYLRPDWWTTLPDRCTAVCVSPLLRELILRTTDKGPIDQRDTVDLAAATLMLDEFQRSEVGPFTLPEPTTAVTQRAAALIKQNGPQTATIQALARATGSGVRWLERHFAAETGLTVGRWRQQLLLFRALEQLAVGASVNVVARNAGYATPSGFVATFRRQFGTSPGRYFALKRSPSGRSTPQKVR